jgi:hypothetical protein
VPLWLLLGRPQNFVVVRTCLSTGKAAPRRERRTSTCPELHTVRNRAWKHDALALVDMIISKFTIIPHVLCFLSNYQPAMPYVMLQHFSRATASSHWLAVSAAHFVVGRWVSPSILIAETVANQQICQYERHGLENAHKVDTAL